MTKREHMVEIPLEDFDEETIQKINELQDNDKLTIGVVLQNYLDASQYGWEDYLDIPEVNAKYHVRAILLQIIEDLDDKIDDVIESLNQED